MKVNGEPLEKWLPKFMDHYKKMCLEIDVLKEMKGKVMELQATVTKMEKDVFGLKAIIPEKDMDAFELGREDKSFSDQIDKKLEKNDEQEDQNDIWNKDKVFGKK